MSALLPGDIIDRKYRVVRTIGTSRVATVVGVQHLVREIELTIKMMTIEGALEPRLVECLLREARLGVTRESAHAPKVYDVALDDGRPYIVMSHVAGAPLTKVDAAILRQVCDAVAASHAVGLVHGTLSAANVFVTPEGHVTVLDFGIASAPTDLPPFLDLEAIASLVTGS